MSVFHKLRTTILRKSISKDNTKRFFHRDNKVFNQNPFQKRLKSKLTSETIDYSQFPSVFLKTLNNIIAPVKRKVLRYNSNPFMDKSLRKAIMTRSRLKNKFNRINSAENWNNKEISI